MKQNWNCRLCGDGDWNDESQQMDSANWHKNNTRLDITGWREFDLQEIMQEIEIWPYY